VHEPAVEVEGATADGVGVDTQFLPEADGRETVGVGREGSAQETGLVQGRAPVLV
jgi:hypothetical protein